MITGNGMVAMAFREAGYDASDVSIFASGVSDSQCTSGESFERERTLLGRTLAESATGGSFVYFGTCSVGDPAQQQSPYVLHKLEMERKVLAHPNGFVFRLPQVAGANAPLNTLVSVICKAIVSKRPITAWRSASRNIIDIVDVVRIVDYLLRQDGALPRIVNVANSNSYGVAQLIASAERALGTTAAVTWIEKGAHYEIDVSYIAPIVAALGIVFDEDYLFQVIRRYYS